MQGTALFCFKNTDQLSRCNGEVMGIESDRIEVGAGWRGDLLAATIGFFTAPSRPNAVAGNPHRVRQAGIELMVNGKEMTRLSHPYDLIPN